MTGIPGDGSVVTEHEVFVFGELDSEGLRKANFRSPSGGGSKIGFGQELAIDSDSAPGIDIDRFPGQADTPLDHQPRLGLGKQEGQNVSPCWLSMSHGRNPARFGARESEDRTIRDHPIPRQQHLGHGRRRNANRQNEEGPDEERQYRGENRDE